MRFVPTRFRRTRLCRATCIQIGRSASDSVACVGIGWLEWWAAFAVGTTDGYRSRCDREVGAEGNRFYLLKFLSRTFGENGSSQSAGQACEREAAAKVLSNTEVRGRLCNAVTSASGKGDALLDA
jgi:hypothetical protein